MRAWQVIACGGNRCAAKLLAFFEYTHNWKLANAAQNRLLNKEWDTEGLDCPYDESVVQWQSEDDLEAGILWEYERKTIGNAFKLLVELGFVRPIEHQHKMPTGTPDRRRYFVLLPGAVNRWLHEVYSSLTNEEKTAILQKKKARKSPIIQKGIMANVPSSINGESSVNPLSNNGFTDQNPITQKCIMDESPSSKNGAVHNSTLKENYINVNGVRAHTPHGEIVSHEPASISTPTSSQATNLQNLQTPAVKETRAAAPSGPTANTPDVPLALTWNKFPPHETGINEHDEDWIEFQYTCNRQFANVSAQVQHKLISCFLTWRKTNKPSLPPPTAENLRLFAQRWEERNFRTAPYPDQVISQWGNILKPRDDFYATREQRRAERMAKYAADKAQLEAQKAQNQQSARS
jgi:hypothetical protein